MRPNEPSLCYSLSSEEFYRQVLVFTPFAASALGLFTLSAYLLLQERERRRNCGRMSVPALEPNVLHTHTPHTRTHTPRYCFKIDSQLSNISVTASSLLLHTLFSQSPINEEPKQREGTVQLVTSCAMQPPVIDEGGEQT